jgi:hypothetical protein
MELLKISVLSFNYPETCPKPDETLFAGGQAGTKSKTGQVDKTGC